MTEHITQGTGNVFADTDCRMQPIVRPRPVSPWRSTTLSRPAVLRQVEAARLLGIPQPRISVLANYRLDGFSVEKLMGFLTALDQDVEIMIRPRMPSGAGEISVLSVR